MWGDMFYSATITLDPPVTLVLHGLLPLHSLYITYMCCFTIYDRVFAMTTWASTSGNFKAVSSSSLSFEGGIGGKGNKGGGGVRSKV